MKKYSKLFAILLAVAMILPGVAGVAEAATFEDNPANVIRLAGSGRVETSIEASKAGFPTAGSATNVVLAGYDGEVDALTGTLLANAKNAPLLLTNKNAAPNVLLDELTRLGAKNVFVLGGKTVVDEAVVTQLKGLGYTVKRVAGADRDLTAQAVAKEAGTQTKHVFLTKGYDNQLADALSVGPASAKNARPVLLTKTNEVPANTKAAMADLGVTHVTIVGGPVAVSTDLENALRAEGKTVDRVAGTTREGTAVAVANTYFPNAKNALVANGYVFYDALVAGYLGAKVSAPIILTATNKMAPVSKAFLTANTDKAWILGGNSSVSTVVGKEIVTAVEGEDLKVTSVSAITETVLATTNQALEFKINEETKAFDLARLKDTDYTLEFAASKAFLAKDSDGSAVTTNSTGKLVDLSAKAGETFDVLLTVKLDGEAVATAEFAAVKVIEGTDWASVEKVDIFGTSANIDGAKLSVLAVDDEAVLIPTELTRNDGKIRSDADDTEAVATDWAESTANQVKKVKSSNTAVLTAAVASDDVELVAIAPGKSTVTVELNNGFEFTKTVEVKAAARVATKATAEDFTLSSVETSKKVEITVVDQYNDPVENGTYYVVSPLDADDAALFAENTSAATDAEGKADVTVAKGSIDKTGVHTLTISTKDPGATEATRAAALAAKIGTVKVSYAKVEAEVKSYALEIHSGSTSKDRVIDAYDATDDQVEFRFVGKDKNGVVAKVAKYAASGTPPAPDTIGFVDNSEFNVIISGDTDAVALTVNDTVENIIKLEAQPNKTGTVVLKVMEGSFERARYTVTVKYSVPTVEGLKLELTEDLKVGSTAVDMDPNDIVKVLAGEDFVIDNSATPTAITNGLEYKVLDKTGGVEIGKIRFTSTNADVFTVTDATNDIKLASVGAQGTKAMMNIQLRDAKGTIVETMQVEVTIK